MSEPGGASTEALLLEAGADELRGLGWEGEIDWGGLTCFAQYSGEAGTWYVSVEAFADEALLLVYSTVPTTVPAQRLAAVTEYLARVNNGLARAGLEVDHDSGIVRCRSSLDVGELDVAGLAASGFLRPLVRRVLRANVATLDMFLPGLEAVLAGQMSPAEADEAAVPD